MATPEQFFSKNLKWITLALFVLFMIKSIQSCNRGMKLRISNDAYTKQIDSINNLYKNGQDSIKKLNFELKLSKERAEFAEEKSKAIQNTVEKLKANTTTTVVVKGVEEVKDTNKK